MQRILTKEEAVQHYVVGRPSHADPLWAALCAAAPNGYVVEPDPLAYDLFWLCYAGEPRLLDKAPPGEEYTLVALKRLERTGFIRRLREFTKLNALYSYMAAADLSEQVRKLADYIEERRDAGKDLGGVPESLLKAADDYEEKLDRAEEIAEEIGMAGPGGQGRGQGEADIPGPTALAQMFQLMHLLKTPRMQAVADHFGRVEALFDAAYATRYERLPAELVGVTQGKDLESLTPFSLMHLVDPTLRDKGWVDYANSSLQQYDKRVRVEDIKGPVIWLVDKSSSMSGEKDEWATAFSMAVRRHCEKTRRDFCVIPFNTQAWGEDPATQENAAFPNRGQWSPFLWKEGKPDARQFLHTFGQGAGGGTSGLAALEAAWWVFDRYDNLKKADIVMVTDGYCGMTPFAAKIRQECARRGMNLYMLLTKYPDRAEALAVTEERFVLEISQLANTTQERAIVQQLVLI